MQPSISPTGPITKPRSVIAVRVLHATGKSTAIADRGFVLAGLVALLLAFAGSARAVDLTRTVKVDGGEREYLVHLPREAEAGKSLPVVLVFHGGGGNAQQMRRMTDMNTTADKHGFIAVYPQGNPSRIEAMRTWNAGNCCGAAQRTDADDVAYVGALLDDLTAVHTIDTRRIYATGMSNGGMLSHRLAAELADRIAAVAPVAGTLGMETIAPSRPVPLLHIHGTQDDFVNFEGGSGHSSITRTDFRSVESTLKAWRKANHCTDEAVEEKLPDSADDGMTATRTTWKPADDSKGAQVVLITIHGGGHTWPGHPVRFRKLGETTMDFDANEVMWQFFKRHALPE